MSDYISFKMQMEIMNRLPVKSLLQFRTVSKSWKSYIDSTAFFFNYGVRYERVFGDSGDSYKHYLLVSFDMINHRFQEIAIPNLLMRGLNSPLYVSKLRNSLVLSGNIPTPAYYVFVCCQLSINGGSITSFLAIMTMPTHHFTKLLGFNNQNKPIVEAATADVMGHRVQVYMENSQLFQYVDIQGNAGSFFIGENLESLILAAHPDRSLYCAG
ncbi:F-box domain containing protein [Tanacetum coccineum]